MKPATTTFPNPSAPAPVYHPAEEFLLDYASGALSSAETLMIATHVAYCASCRQAVGAAKATGGALLDDIEPARLPPNMLNRMLAAIDANGVPPAPEPRSLSRLLNENLSDPRWRKLPGGFRMRRVSGEGDASGRVWLFDAPPGMRLLPHRHSGDEWTVILTGLFVDNDRSYRVGDFASLADGEEHRPVIGMEGRCVSLIMVRESPFYTTLPGRVAAPFIKL
jgi:putative transcriptional regulator